MQFGGKFAGGRFASGRFAGLIGTVAQFTVEITGLTDGKALEGTDITSAITGLEGGEVVTYAWEREGGDDLEGITGQTIPVDFEGGDLVDGGVVRSVVTIDGVTYRSRFYDVVTFVPVITDQPSIISGLSTNADLLIDVGLAERGQAEITTLTIDGVDQTANLTGTTLPSTFNTATGNGSLQVTWTSTGGVTLSDVISFTIASNDITPVTAPVLDPMFTDDAFADSAWFDGTALTEANYTNAPAGAVIFYRGQTDDFQPRHGVNYRGVIGERVRFVVDIYPAGWTGGGSPLASFPSNYVTVEYERTITATDDNTFEIEFNPNFPLTSIANPIVINGTSYQPNATRADYEDVNSAVNFAPPTVTENADDSALVDIFKGFWTNPTGTPQAVNCTARQGATVLDADVGDTFDVSALSGTITFDFSLNGVTVSVGYAVPAAGYVQKTFNVGAGGAYLGTGLTGSRLLVGLWMQRPVTENGRVFDINNYTRIEAYLDGSVNFKITRGNGSANIELTTPADVLPVDGKTFVGMSYDIADAAGAARVGATTYTLPASVVGFPMATGNFTLFERDGGGRRYTQDFADFVVQMDGQTTLSDLYNGGTAPDPSSLIADVILGGDMTVDDLHGIEPPVNGFKEVDHLGTILLNIASGDETFTEVV